MMWVYSGRRGIHCWVCDTRARKLTQVRCRTIVIAWLMFAQEARSAIASYMNVFQGGEKSRRANLGFSLHHSIRTAFDILKPYFFKDVLGQYGQVCDMQRDVDVTLLQNLLGTQKGMDAMLACLEEFTQLVAKLRDEWARNPSLTSPQRWTVFEEVKKQLLPVCTAPMLLVFDQHTRKRQIISKPKSCSRSCIRASMSTCPLVFVSLSCCGHHQPAQVNHLLKSPFVAHPKTGRVCVPIDHTNPDAFSPFVVPDLADLVGELDEGREGMTGRNSALLQPYMDVFFRFLDGLKSDNAALRKQLRGACNVMVVPC